MRDLIERADAERIVRTLDAEAVRRNHETLRLAAGGRLVLPVLKGDAYGLGASRVSEILGAQQGTAVAVDTIAEGLDLRDAGAIGPVVVMDVDVAANAADAVNAQLTPGLAACAHVREYARQGGRAGRTVGVWLRTNIGFNRFGGRTDEEFRVLCEEAERRGATLRVDMVFAHLANVHDEEAVRQSATFRRRLAMARAILGDHVEGSLAATHGLLHEECLEDTACVRPGIGLYGGLDPSARKLPRWSRSTLAALESVLSLRARVLDVVHIAQEEGVCYARDHHVEPGRILAAVAIGFSRGLPMSCGSVHGLIGGHRCRLVGRPGMDCTQFDVTEVRGGVRPGDWMTFIGREDGGCQTIEEFRDAVGCGIYELFAGLGRVPLRVSDGEPSESLDDCVPELSPRTAT